MKRFVSALIVLCSVFSLLSFSCSKKKTIGEPYILFEIHGTVYGKHKTENVDTPQEGDYKYVTGPVKGIRVSSGQAEPVYTDSKGRFVLYGRQAPSDAATLVFIDDDAALNGGPYQRASVNVKMRQRDGGDDRNYEGYWFASGIEVELLLKNESLDTDDSFN